jgi:hypothetical protein
MIGLTKKMFSMTEKSSYIFWVWVAQQSLRTLLPLAGCSSGPASAHWKFYHYVRAGVGRIDDWRMLSRVTDQCDSFENRQMFCATLHGVRSPQGQHDMPNKNPCPPFHLALQVSKILSEQTWVFYSDSDAFGGWTTCISGVWMEFGWTD